MERMLDNIVFKTVKSEWDVYFDMALEMLREIMENNKAGRKTVMIVPVGPTEQYPILARLVNQLQVSLRDVYFFNMDEYLLTPEKTIDYNNPMSFHYRMNSEFYSRVDEKLLMPESQRIFPEPGKEAELDAMIESLGGVDLCLGGLGINGHIAFNEPPEPDTKMSAEEFAALGTRILPISRETKTINAYGYQRGDLRGMPEWCITVGMKQILASRKVYIALNRPWQHGIVKHVLFDDVQAEIPASLLKMCGNVKFCASEEISKGLFEE
ncbi:MAG: glucosamine-6-phosphate isomerase [Ruminococcaceae bacterium]|nr:glucosamine-6-phosphate isomerase [Oscillospiraceae bacterium]